ncbi:hypothetical protein [Longitalea luteola]|uniref:hypothetical protein n=1 Tax=Longitalea luteola TaxID=2812563 RepID=UPI001A9694BC|nr:hypothetical protein [Longitalea luteola]
MVHSKLAMVRNNIAMVRSNAEWSNVVMVRNNDLTPKGKYSIDKIISPQSGTNNN